MTIRPNSSSTTAKPDTSAWKEIVARYQKSSVRRATWQIVNTLVPYTALWYLMYLSLRVSWWLVIPLEIGRAHV